MAESSYHEMASPLTPFDGYERSSDGESLVSKDELKRKKRIKMIIYVGIFVVLQVIVITVLSLTVMQAKVPRATLAEFDVQTLNYDPETPSFNMSFKTQITIKNTNWGIFRFGPGNLTFHSQGRSIGKAVIPKSKVGMRSTKKINVEVSLNYARPESSELRWELNGGVLTMTSQTELSGNVRLMYILKKLKYAAMVCHIYFDLSTKEVRSYECL